MRTLHFLELDWEADEFMQYIADLERNEDGALQIMYGIDGRRDLTETLREELSGYAGARPVRIGNGAFAHAKTMCTARRWTRCSCIPGVASDCRSGCGHSCNPRPSAQPPSGANPTRGLGGARRTPALRLLQADVLGCARPGGQARRDPGRSLAAATLGAGRGRIKADILERGVDRRGVLRQHYDTDALDASALLAAIFGFLPGDDPRLRATVLAIADELTDNGYVLRYRTHETDDGLTGEEGTFLICSFWLVSALVIIDQHQRARDLMERLIRVASPLGLYAEEYDVATARHLGNFPQAFSHLALVEAASRIILADRLQEVFG